MDFKKHEIGIFPKEIVHEFGRKVEVFSFLSLSKIDQETVFPDVLDTKEAFKDYKNICLWKTQKWKFSKGVSPCFSSKIGNFLNFDFYAK